MYIPLDNFLCECDCEESEGTATPTRTATPVGDWMACWETSNEEWDLTGNPPNYGDWDGAGSWDWVYSTLEVVTTPAPLDGTYSLKTEASCGSGFCAAAPYLECEQHSDDLGRLRETGWFSATVQIDQWQGYYDTVLFAAVNDDAYENQLGITLLSLFSDIADSHKIKVFCNGPYSCASDTEWVCYDGSPTLDTWHTFELYWDLPFDSAAGKVHCWWDGVHNVSEDAVVTSATGNWREYNRIYAGAVDEGYAGVNSIEYWDICWDCLCGLTGNVTPTPPVP